MAARHVLLLLAALFACACVSSPDAPELWSAEVTIDSSPSGAQLVWFRPRTQEQPGGPVELGTTPYTWEVSRALIGSEESVSLVVFAPSHGRAQVELPVETLRSGEPVQVDIPQFASLEVHSDPIATFTLTDAAGVPAVEGEYAPRLVNELTPGTYTLHAERDGYAPHDAEVVLRAGERAALRYALERLPAPEDGEPRMALRPVAVEGLDAFVFYEALVGQMRNVSGCYDRALVDDPTAEGEIRVALQLNLGFGRVDGAEIIETAIDDAETLDCVQRRLRRIEYAPPGAEGTGRAEIVVHFHRIAQ